MKSVSRDGITHLQIEANACTRCVDSVTLNDIRNPRILFFQLTILNSSNNKRSISMSLIVSCKVDYRDCCTVRRA